jgi:glucose/mannose transport system substrate-binding protein
MATSESKTRLTCLLAGAALVTACSSGAGDGSSPKPLEVYSWLTSGSEGDALGALFGVITRQDSRMKITNSAQDNPSMAQAQLKTRMAEGIPPDSFQVVSGRDLDDWIDRLALEPLDGLASAQSWGGVIPPPVLQSVGSMGTLYGVPLDIERDNTLFYNKAVFAAAGVALPKTLTDVFFVAEALKAKGVTPFEVSASGGWTIASHLFESVLVAQAGPDFYEAYLTGQKAADAAEIRTALNTVAWMMDLSNEDRSALLWSDAVKEVCAGHAAMLVLPDFVKGEFAHDGCGPETIDYMSMEPPGTPTFVFVSITFELPKGAPHRDDAIEFLKAVGSMGGQDSFNPIKGAISARIDSDLAKYDTISRRTASEFRSAGERLVPGYAALTTTDVQGNVNAALQAFVDPSNSYYKSVDAVVAVLTQNYGALQR